MSESEHYPLVKQTNIVPIELVKQTNAYACMYVAATVENVAAMLSRHVAFFLRLVSPS